MQYRIISKGVNWINSCFIKIRKRVGPRTKSWGTPAMNFEDADKTLSTQNA
jgi:hypothetical protein